MQGRKAIGGSKDAAHGCHDAKGKEHKKTCGRGEDIGQFQSPVVSFRLCSLRLFNVKGFWTPKDTIRAPTKGRFSRPLGLPDRKNG